MDRRKLGCKKSILCDGRGTPLAIGVPPSNQHDTKTLSEVFENLAVKKILRGSAIYADKGYDDGMIVSAFGLMGVNAIIPRRGARSVGRPRKQGKKRWMVERTHSWTHQFRRIKTRWEKYSINYLGLLQVACAIITYRQVLG